MADVKTISLEELKNVVRGKLAEAPSLRQLAARLDISPASLSLLLAHPESQPGPLLLKALGYKSVIVYQKTK